MGWRPEIDSHCNRIHYRVNFLVTASSRMVIGSRLTFQTGCLAEGFSGVNVAEL